MKLSRAFEVQSKACVALGSPFMGRLLKQLDRIWRRDSVLGQAVEDWPDTDIGPGGASIPLRLAGGLHYLVLTGQAPGLVAAYPPNTVSDTGLGNAVGEALTTHEAFLLNWIKSPPQTNEVRRSAPIIAAGHWLAARYALPIYTSELGASAGLNLMWDTFALATSSGRLGPENATLTFRPDWQGPLPGSAPLQVVNRRGVDLNPIDSSDPEQAMRLLSYLWPDQPDRANLAKAAINAQNAPVDCADAVDWLENRLNTVPPGHLHLIYNTIAWQYFPADAAKRGRELLEAKGRKATTDNPIAWFAMENDGGAQGVALTLRLWPGELCLNFGRADFHGRWIKWDAPAIARES